MSNGEIIVFESECIKNGHAVDRADIPTPRNDYNRFNPSYEDYENRWKK